MFCSTSSIVTPLALSSAKRAEDLLHQQRRQAQRRLVKQQHPRPGHEGATQCQHLLLAAREGAGRLSHALGQDREQGVDALAIFGDAGAIGPRGSTQAQVLRHGQAAEDTAAFGAMGDAQSHDPGRRQTMDRFALERDPPGPRAREARDGAQHGALAGTVGAQQCHHLAGGDAQVDPTDRRHRAIVDAQVGDLEQRRRGRLFASRRRLAAALAQAWPR